MIVSFDSIKDITFRQKKTPEYLRTPAIAKLQGLKNINLRLEIMDHSNFGMMFFL